MNSCNAISQKEPFIRGFGCAESDHPFFRLESQPKPIEQMKLLFDLIFFTVGLLELDNLQYHPSVCRCWPQRAFLKN